MRMDLPNREELEAKLGQIIEKPLRDASMRRNDPAFWLGTSKMVTAAAWSAKNAIDRSIDEAIAQNSLVPILVEVRRSYDKFFFENDDGSGAGTFADILREIESLMDRSEAVVDNVEV